MTREYNYLTPEERAHFVEHGWLRVPNAINPKYLEQWMENLWTRLGYDPDDKSTWKEEYIKLPRHREVPVYEFCPDAWNKMVEIVGGNDNIDPVRERYHGDQFIINFGSERWKTQSVPPSEAPGWHTDNDWYRQFLDSSGNALTIIHCFTDVPEDGGGTVVAEDGIKGLCERLSQLSGLTACTQASVNISMITPRVLIRHLSTSYTTTYPNAVNSPQLSQKREMYSSHTACYHTLKGKIVFTTLVLLQILMSTLFNHSI